MLNPFAHLRWLSLFLLASLCVSAQAQRDDWHVQSGELFVKSPFAHGYMHGYEEGFHAGDLDLQMGRSYRDVKSQSEYKKITGYRDQYGEKSDFADGYKKGYLVGYTDCFSGRNFRAVQLLTEARESYPSSSLTVDRNFDRAFRKGYENGQRQGLADGRSMADAQDPVNCPINTSHEGIAPEYCVPYRDGYQLGYSDGFANQRRMGDVFARNK